MNVRLVAATAVLAAVCALSAGARAATGDLPDLGSRVAVGRLPQGGTYIVHPTSGAPVAAIELWYRAPSTGFGPKPVSSLARLAAQVVAASKPLVGDPLGKQVSDAGGRLAITVYSDSVSIAAVVPSQEARRITKSLTTAFFAPVVTDDGFRFAQRDVAQEALLQSFNPETIVRDSIFGSLFSSGPQHYPPVRDAQRGLDDLACGRADLRDARLSRAERRARDQRRDRFVDSNRGLGGPSRNGRRGSGRTAFESAISRLARARSTRPSTSPRAATAGSDRRSARRT